MKRKILLGSASWLILITVLHIQLNVGWARLGNEIQVALGRERAELVVGFLPVT